MFELEIRNPDFSLDVSIKEGDLIEFVDPTLDIDDREIAAGAVGKITSIDSFGQMVVIDVNGQTVHQTLGSVIQGFRED